MKAAVFYGRHDLRIQEIDAPTATPGNILVQVKACGICGTDMHIFDGDEGAAPTPSGTVLGHEFSGEVIAVGDGVTNISVGDHVCIDPNQLCNTCNYCREGLGHFCENMIGIGTTVHGGFAEYCSIPQSQAYKFDKKLSYAAAAMTEPVACCLHGIDMCEINPGATVAVIGGGMIGLLMLQLAKLKGASKLILIEPVAAKRELGLTLGADLTIDPFTQDAAEILRNDRIDVVIECVGRTETMAQAVTLAGKKSTVMLFGLTKPDDTLSIKPFELFKKEIVLKASFINPYTQARALRLIESGKIDVTSMVYKTIAVDDLPNTLKDKKELAQGKHIVVFE